MVILQLSGFCCPKGSKSRANENSGILCRDLLSYEYGMRQVLLVYVLGPAACIILKKSAQRKPKHPTWRSSANNK